MLTSSSSSCCKPGAGMSKPRTAAPAATGGSNTTTEDASGNQRSSGQRETHDVTLPATSPSASDFSAAPHSYTYPSSCASVMRKSGRKLLKGWPIDSQDGPSSNKRGPSFYSWIHQQGCMLPPKLPPVSPYGRMVTSGRYSRDSKPRPPCEKRPGGKGTNRGERARGHTGSHDVLKRGIAPHSSGASSLRSSLGPEISAACVCARKATSSDSGA